MATFSLRSANYRIDFTKMTLTMTADFALKAYDPSTEEYEILTRLKKDFPDRRSCVIFISDHGESLGEDGNYMHGLPKSVAPACQLEIPFIIWTSDDSLRVKEITNAGPYNIYHTTLNFLGLEAPFYDESKNIFE